MRARRITPSAIVTGQSKVRRTEISGRNNNRRAAGMAPSRVICTFDFETGAAAQPIVKQRRTQRRRVHSVPLAVQVPIPTSSTCTQTHKLKIQNLNLVTHFHFNFFFIYPLCRRHRSRRRTWHGHSPMGHRSRRREFWRRPSTLLK